MLSQTLVNSSDIVAWANRNSAADHLPSLVRRLILTTAPKNDLISFPSDEGVHIGGYDGIVLGSEGTVFVPAGDSVWEMGKEDNPKGKADSDYKKRIDNSGEVSPSNTTFVFVTPRRWGRKTVWIKARQAEGIWKDVRAYDADDLATWLELAPSVHIWLSRQLGKRPDGAEDLEQFWQNWSQVTVPPTVSEIVIAGREELAGKVREWIEAAPSALGLRADTYDEAMAFLAAAIDGLPPAERAAALVRAVVVDDPPAFRHLVGSGQGLLLVPRFSDPLLMVEAVRNRHHVFVALAQDDTGVGNTLVASRRRREPIEKALAASGIDRDKASSLATLARRSMTAFRRSLSPIPGFSTPGWAEPQSARQVFPALLAEQWRDDSAGDREAMAKLAGKPYEEVSEALHRWATLPDAPVRRIGASWMLASKEDAWRLLAPRLTPRDLDAFCEAAFDILSEVDPMWDLEPDRRYMAGILGATARCSPLLRKGMAGTLAVFAARGEALRSGGADAQARVEHLVQRLLDNANQDWRMWASLSHELSLLAEAAPEAFLSRLSLGLQTVIPLFATSDNLMTARTPHAGILWALETLAWNPDLLGRVAAILAVLTRQDPGAGSNQGNRPLSSLREIFLCWHPQTAAPFEQRLRVLDTLRNKEPGVAWALLPSLIVKRGIAHPSHTPKFRDWVPEGDPQIQHSELLQSATEATTRLIEDAGSSGKRWSDALNEFANLPPTGRERICARLGELDVSKITAADALAIRRAIEDLVASHREFPDAEWKLPSEEVDRLAVIAEHFEVSDLVMRHAWLFGNCPNLPDVRRGEDWEEYDKVLRSRRSVAISEIYATGGMVSVQTLIEHCESPWAVGLIVGQDDLLGDDTADEMLNWCLKSEIPALKEGARTLIIGRFDRGGWPWAEVKLKDRSVSGDTPSLRAAFYGGLPRIRSTWQRLEQEDEETQHHYWATWQAYHLEESDGYEYVTRALLRFGQPLTALHLSHRPGRKGDLLIPIPLAIEALEAALSASEEDWTRNRNVARDIPDLLGTLAASKEVEEVLVTLERLEWEYLPLFNHLQCPVLLARKLASDPEWLIEAVKFAYKPRHAEPEQLSEQGRALAERSHGMLRSWRKIPGSDDEGGISLDSLLSWTMRARELAAECDRAEITDQTIGSVLAFSPPDPDGSWPHTVVRNLIDTVGSDHIEVGFAVQISNNRGVTTRLPTDGGTQEKEIAERYEKEARAIGDRWPRTAATLRRLADTYRQEAEREDLRAEFTEDSWT